MSQKVLDTMLQRRGRRGAARAGALHIEVDDAVLEAAESNVAAVIGHRWPYPGFDQVLDHANRFSVSLAEKLLSFVGGLVAGHAAIGEKRRARHVMFHDGAENCGLRSEERRVGK